MAETKDAVAAERDALRAENEQLRGQLVQATSQPVGRAPYRPAAQFFLSEGDRQELEMYGVATIHGRLMTTAEVRDALKGTDQANVEIKDAKPGADRAAAAAVAASHNESHNVRGVTYVYPSVADGLIDPAVAGRPGISGPAAEIASDGTVKAPDAGKK